ncbi:hypothetical protein J2752_001999 [Halarchaeum rubridurum]|nr:hypothetical protein [Halarchaeum rubridurum]MBP1955087.1 hypothetical protein [Halarchaeum rubridurum]
MGQYGVVFSLEFGSVTEVIVYFRGYESQSGRMEQYYARAISDMQPDLTDINSAIISKAEQRHGLEIEESASGENFFNTLQKSIKREVASRDQCNRINYLLSRGHQLRFGIPSYEEGLQLISQIQGMKPGLRVAVVQGEGRVPDSLGQYDLVIEKGDYVSLEPLDRTEELMDPSTVDHSTDDRTISVDNRTINLTAALESIAISVGVIVLLSLLYVAVALIGLHYLNTSLPGAEVIKNTIWIW